MRQLSHSVLLSGLLLATATTNAADKPAGITLVPAGAGTVTQAPADHFTGQAQVSARFGHPAPSRLGGGLVTFEPGARTAWHSHPLGQTLFITAGHGWIQSWGDVPVAMHAGDMVWIPPGVKHWHGAAPGSAMAHIAVSEALDGRSVTWMEQVSDTQYPAKNLAQ